MGSCPDTDIDPFFFREYRKSLSVLFSVLDVLEEQRAHKYSFTERSLFIA